MDGSAAVELCSPKGETAERVELLAAANLQYESLSHPTCHVCALMCVCPIYCIPLHAHANPSTKVVELYPTDRIMNPLLVPMALTPKAHMYKSHHECLGSFPPYRSSPLHHGEEELCRLQPSTAATMLSCCASLLALHANRHCMLRLLLLPAQRQPARCSCGLVSRRDACQFRSATTCVMVLNPRGLVRPS